MSGSQPMPVQAVERPTVVAAATLPTNTAVTLSMNEELTTKGGRIEVGTKFGLTLTHDIMLGDLIVILKGLLPSAR